LASKTLLLFDDFNKGTIDLLNENIINRTAASKWMTDDASYTFIFDKEPILKYTNKQANNKKNQHVYPK